MKLKQRKNKNYLKLTINCNMYINNTHTFQSSLMCFFLYPFIFFSSVLNLLRTFMTVKSFCILKKLLIYYIL